MKKVAKFFGGLLILALVLIGGAMGWWRYQSAKYGPVAVAYLNRVLPELTRWDKNVAKQYMAPAALKGSSDEDLTKMFDWFKKVGALKHLDEPALTHIFSGMTPEVGMGTILTYTIHGQFEAGEAVLTVRLVMDGEDFKILFFHMQSKALIGGA